jgi:hypothetical protein
MKFKNGNTFSCDGDLAYGCTAASFAHIITGVDKPKIYCGKVDNDFLTSGNCIGAGKKAIAKGTCGGCNGTCKINNGWGENVPGDYGGDAGCFCAPRGYGNSCSFNSWSKVSGWTYSSVINGGSFSGAYISTNV